MVGKIAAGCLSLILAGCAAARPADAQDLCAALTVPTDLGLACGPAPDTAPGAVHVQPSEGAFSALSQLSLRPLERTGADALAWSDPPAWLQRRVTLEGPSEPEGGSRLEGLAQDPDSPFAGPSAEGALRSLENLLAGVARLPLSACNAPGETATGRWTMDCSFTAGGIGLFVQHRLVAAGERRWAITMRAANEQRLRHFEAIANSFAPPPAALP